MDRLTKRKKLKLSNGEEIVMCKHTDSECNDSCMSIQPCKWYKKVQEKLKEYEDAEEQGLLLKLPCKVGSIVWWIEYEFIEECVVEEYGFDFNGNVFCEFVSTDHTMTARRRLEDFGKTVFLTQAEAEKALKQKGE